MSGTGPVAARRRSPDGKSLGQREARRSHRNESTEEELTRVAGVDREELRSVKRAAHC